MPGPVPTYRPPSFGASPTPGRYHYERRPDRAEDKRFYKSPTWLAVRAIKLRMNLLCEDCERRGVSTVANHVHHVIERKDRPDLQFHLDNLESCCAACHNAKRRKPR